ncbi:MAG: hypothetical protein Q8L48_30860 [Archangium sp.]|nr:hypothetical protein [Archangium sp.]
MSDDWKPAYWQKDPHSTSWEQVKAALQRDWEQTRADFAAGGTELDQQVSDTVLQASGLAPIPGEAVPNPGALSEWTIAEQGMRYGHGAHLQYGAAFEKWNDQLELKLAQEWDEAQTGKPFAAVLPHVRAGWNARP